MSASEPERRSLRGALARLWALPSQHPRGALVALFLLSIALFLPSLPGDFVWDDVGTIVASPRLRGWGAVLESFRHPAAWSGGYDAGAVGTYRPLSLASFVVEHELFGLRPLGFHATSVLLHGLASTAVLLFFRRAFARQRPAQPALEQGAFWLALAFALHPSHVESVTWINGRSEVFGCLFGVLALALVLARRFTHAHGALFGLCLLLAVLGKETSVAFYPLGVLFAAWVWREERDRSRVLRAVGYTVAAGVAYMAMRRAALGSANVPSTSGLSSVLSAVPAVWLRMLQEIVLPIHPGIGLLGTWLHELSRAERFAAWATAPVALAALVVLLRRRAWLSLFGLAWWLVSLAPIAFLVVMDWPGLNRWIYIGLPGLFLCVWPLLSQQSERLARALLLGAIALYVPLLEGAIAVWRHDESLYRATIEDTPGSYFGYAKLGLTMAGAQRWPEAMVLLHRAVELGVPGEMVMDSVARGLVELGRCEAGAQLYPRTRHLRVAPADFAEATGRCLRTQGRTAEALERFRSCAHSRPACRAGAEALERETARPAPSE